MQRIVQAGFFGATFWSLGIGITFGIMARTHVRNFFSVSIARNATISLTVTLHNVGRVIERHRRFTTVRTFFLLTFFGRCQGVSLLYTATLIDQGNMLVAGSVFR